jgi:hypothetical protein
MISKTPLSGGYTLEDKLNFLKKFTDLGFRCFPLHYPLVEGCSCLNPECSSIGKHPAITGWQRKATSNYDILKLNWERDPNLNIGITTGKESEFSSSISTDQKGLRFLKRKVLTILRL